MLWASPGAGKSTLLRQYADRESAAGRSVVLVDGRDEASVRWALAHRVAHTVLVDNADALTGPVLGDLAAALDDVATPRLIVAGRRDPLPVSPTRWLATRELRTADLAFSAAETAELLRGRGVTLTPDSLAALVDHTEGWAAGVALACHVFTTSADPDAVAASFTGDHHAIGDYLVDAVLATLTDVERAVLVGAAVRPAVSAALAVAVTGRDDAGDILESLVRRNLLIERSGIDRYVYHAVLYAYLSAEARRTAPEQLRAAHARAARHALQDDPSAALRHAVSAEDEVLVDAILRRHGIDLVLRGDDQVFAVVAHRETDAAVLLRRMLDTPHVEESPDPDAVLRPWDAASAAVADALHSLRARGADAAGALELPPDDPTDAVRPGARAFTEVVRAYRSVTEHAVGPERDASTAVGELHRLGAEAADRGDDWLRIVAFQSALTVSLETPRWKDAVEELRGTLRGSIPPHVLATGVGSRAMLFDVCLAYQRCEPLPGRSVRTLRSADFARRHPRIAHRARVVEALAGIAGSSSREGIERLDRLMVDGMLHDPAFLSFALVPWLSAAAHHGNRPMLDYIAACAHRAFGPRAVETALAAFVVRRDRDAEWALREALEDDAPTWDAATTAQARIRLAVHAAAHGAVAKARHDLGEAVIAAHHVGVVRPFLLFEADALPLLRAHAEHLGPTSGTASALLAAADAAVADGDTTASVLLTARERALLDELPIHQTVIDIARRQQVSPNTVKSQLKSVYRKLGVDNRADAIAAGRRAGLLE
jgi:LuxR family transcriptional regulator, maltose regulon positive regulatory protein